MADTLGGTGLGRSNWLPRLYSPHGTVSRRFYTAWLLCAGLLFVYALAPVVVVVSTFLVVAFFSVVGMGCCGGRGGGMSGSHFSDLWSQFTGGIGWLLALAIVVVVLILPTMVTVPMKRLRDAGMSAWWVLAIWLVPFFGWVLALALCLIEPAPPERRIDVPAVASAPGHSALATVEGKVIIAAVIALLVLLIASFWPAL